MDALILSAVFIAAPLASDLADLQGKWRMVSMEAMGAERLEGGKFENKVISMEIRGTTMTSDQGRPSFRLDPFDSPKALDVVDKGQVTRGIYEIKNGRLRMCFQPLIGGPQFAPKDVPRPKEFDGRRVLVIYERVAQ